MPVGIASLATHFPERVIDNAALAARNPRYAAARILAKTGIERRYIAGPDELASDLAVAAARRLFTQTELPADQIDYLIFCTQAPDYFLPTSACIIHQQLGLRANAGALDINLGCSGFVYGLGLAQGLIRSGQAQRVLLLTADTYSKFIEQDDFSLLTIFGDGAAATLVTETAGALGPFVYGTDGGGAANLIVPTGGLRRPDGGDGACYVNVAGQKRAGLPLHMNGPEVFNFSIGAVPNAISQLYEASGLTPDAIDLYVLHQANATMLEALRRKLTIDPARFYVNLADGGNTVSSTIPIALSRAADAGRLAPGMRVMLVGFGVGYSWAATILTWG